MSKRKSYRQVLAENSKKTNIIIGVFLLIYLFVGLLIDVAWQYPGLLKVQPDAKLVESFMTFKIKPFGTIIMILIGIVSVFVTFSMHDKMMLWGSEYEEIQPGTDLMIEAQSLYNVVEELKIAANLNYMPKVYLIHADYMNAFASGYSEKSAMVAITTGLIAKLDRAELQAVMAHEISHIKHMDIKLTLFVGVLSNIIILALDLLMDLLRFTSSSKDSNSNSNGAKAIVMLIVFVLRLIFPFIALLLTMFLSRTREYMADAGAVKLTRDKDAMATALLKIHVDYEENEYEDAGVKVRKAAYIYNPIKSLFGDMLSTHPPLEERLRNLGHSFEKETEPN